MLSHCFDVFRSAFFFFTQKRNQLKSLDHMLRDFSEYPSLVFLKKKNDEKFFSPENPKMIINFYINYHQLRTS